MERKEYGINIMRKRRYRQIGRLIYYYCCVRYMTRQDGRWVDAADEDGIKLKEWARKCQRGKHS